MFTVVTEASKKQHILKPMKLSMIHKNGVKFYVISVRHSKRMNWSKLERLLGDTKKRVVLPSTIERPLTSSIQLVDDVGYAHVMTRQALHLIFEEHYDYLRKQAVCLIDIFCRHQSYADILTDYFSVVYVVTNREKLYLNYQQAKFYEKGASVFIVNTLKNNNLEVPIFVSPDGIIFPEMEETSVPVITAKPINHMEHISVYHSFCSEIPDEYEKICPDGISPRLFQAALYEYCGLRHLSMLSPAFGMKNTQRKSMKEIIFNIFSIDTK